ncbi:hypothetical protein ACC691_37550, partial [Rhizobium johnstonii]|uniref:hypothetical protein n=1 Tax=Rhizobium johnstonii TaxID=3019933 RepID=UPI003F969E77
MNRHTASSRLSTRTKILASAAAGIVILGSLASAPFVANAAAEQSAAARETTSLNQQNSLDHSQLSAYSDLAEIKVKAQAKAALDGASTVLAS